MGADSRPSELDQLRRENARLIGLLEAHGIAWRSSEHRQSEPPPVSAQPAATTPGSAQEKVALFQPGVCEKPRISCRDCNHRELLPLSDAAIYGHLAGDHTIGLYPLLDNDHCRLLAVDFDEQDWRDDARAFLRSCRELAVPAALEISRSGEGAHVWVFFEEAVSAREARQLGAALISHTCNATRQLRLSSYDRLFPNQDTLPKGGFGNLIALPLQKEALSRSVGLSGNPAEAVGGSAAELDPECHRRCPSPRSGVHRRGGPGNSMEVNGAAIATQGTAGPPPCIDRIRDLTRDQ